MKTEAQKKANEKWQKEKVDTIIFRVPKGQREIIKRCAEANGETVNAMLKRLTDEEIKLKLK